MKGLAVLCVVAPVLAASPVSKVIELIDDLHTKVTNTLSSEAKQMEEYTVFCDDEATEKGFAIKTASRAIENFSAVIEDTTGQIQELASIIESSGSEAAAKSQELQSATDVRENEHADFQVAQKELVEAIDTLARATVIIKREMSFVQGKASSKQLQKKLGALSTALNTVISASWIDLDAKKRVEAFMSTDDELSLTQPQASVKNYESKSGGIVEALEEMKDKAEEQLNSLRRDETKSRHAFEMVKQGLSDGVAVLEKRITQSNASKSASEEKLAKAQGDLASTQASKSADEKYLAKLNAECQAKAADWDARQKAANDELAALAKGKEILSAKFGFMQVAVKAQRVKSDFFGSRDKVLALLRKLGRNYNSFAMMQIANAATSDPFVKVRGMIENMISKLQKHAQEEATHEAFCQEETKKSAKARDTKSAASDKYQARIDEAKAGMAEMKNQVAELSDEIAHIDKSNAEATRLRNNENAEYKKASKDFKEAAEAVTQALVVLKDFYRGDSFLQQPSFGGARGDAGHAIIEILEVAEADFTKMLAEAEAGESEASASYKGLMQENKVAKSTKRAEVKAKNSEIKSLTVALAHHSEDLDTVSKELSAVMDYIEKLKPQCESRAMTYEERKAKRDAEIAGLKDALSILESDEGAAAFIQKKTGFLQ